MTEIAKHVVHVITTETISESLSIKTEQVTAVIELFEEGASIPFISRYRKEATGSLDEMQVADIQAGLKKFKVLIKRDCRHLRI